MSPPQQSEVCNRLLKRLSLNDFDLIRPHLQPMPIEFRQTLIAPHQPITHLYFPETGYAAVMAEPSDGRIEVGVTGREGLIGASPVLLDSGPSPYHEIVQCPGKVLVIDAASFCTAVDHSPSLRKLMLRYVQTTLIQSRQSAYANAAFKMDVRLARWLLMCHDRVDGDEIPITHEMISFMLGVRRPGVTSAVAMLEDAALIRARRGRITVVNRNALIAHANQSYGLAEAEYARLIEGA